MFDARQGPGATHPTKIAPMSSYLKNAWYVAALSPDIGRELRAVQLLGEPVVLYRKQDGTAVALEDVCPHRRLPLSLGRLKNDAVECGYHGLTFDCSGACIDAATQPRIPPFARVRSYPTCDRYGLLWVWMGDPALASVDEILDIPTANDPSWSMTRGDSMRCTSNYLWLVDNLLDPSHVAWVHRGSFAGAGTDDTPLEVTTLPNGVLSRRWMLDKPPPPFYAPLVKFQGHADRLQHYEMRYPAVGINMGIYTPAGLGGPRMVDGPSTYRMISYHFITPVDEDHTHYFWLQHRNTDPHDEALTRRIAEGARAAFEEDRVILEAIHKGMKGRKPESTGMVLDAAAARFRRGLAERIAREAAPQAASGSL